MILILAQHQDGKPVKTALELVTAARKLGGDVTALVTGPGAATAAAALDGLVERVLVAEDVPGTANALVTALQQAAAGASRVLMASNRTGQSVAPRVAIRLDAGLLEDVTALETGGASVSARRFSYLSRVTETVESGAGVTVITVKPGAFDAATPSGVATATEQLGYVPGERDGAISASEPQAAAAGRVPLGEASVVVAGGRGVGSADAFSRLVEPLAGKLGAGIGATRAVVDAGWRPFAEQVGQTGVTVQPTLYIALGISGAVQHLSGMNRSRVVVAINKDGDAPLVKASDYAIVGDVSQVVPEILAALEE